MKTISESKSNTEKNGTVRDSTVIHTEKTVKPLVVPSSGAELRVSPEDLKNLPAGGGFHNKSGNATVGAKKEKDGTLTITANCDSLILLVENLKTEAHHFRNENMALKSELSERTTEIVQEPSGWQWFQIWWGRILTAALIAGLIYKRIKNHLKLLKNGQN